MRLDATGICLECGVKPPHSIIPLLSYPNTGLVNCWHAPEFFFILAIAHHADLQ
jgi:hypothetical protein